MWKIPIIITLLFAGAVGQASPDDELRGRIISTAKKYLGARYRYGSQGAGGFDCSGFVQHVFRENGISLPRSTVDQFEKARKIEMADARPGDLVFFRIYRRRVSHVGIYAGGSTFIHAPTWGKRVGFADMNLAYWKNTFAGAGTFIVPAGDTPAGP